MFKLIRRCSFQWLLILTVVVPAWRSVAQTNTNTSQWEKEIAAFEASDRTNPPAKGAIVFVGSSTIRKWTDLKKDFPGKDVVDRGFGGSQISDAIQFADRIIFPYEPKIVVFYSGDNDLASGKSVKRVVADYETFFKKIHEHLPSARIVCISIKPCPQRWKSKDKVISVNEQIAALKDDQLTFVDIYPLMLGEDGKPKPELFLKDGLHPSVKCYQMWAEKIRPVLEANP